MKREKYCILPGVEHSSCCEGQGYGCVAQVGDCQEDDQDSGGVQSELATTEEDIQGDKVEKAPNTGDDAGSNPTHEETSAADHDI